MLLLSGIAKFEPSGHWSKTLLGQFEQFAQLARYPNFQEIWSGEYKISPKQRKSVKS